MTGTLALSDAMDSRWAREGTRVAIREGDGEITFRDLLRWSQAISRTLEPTIREPGQRVALLLPNSAAFVAAFFGVARLAGVVAPLGIQYRSQELLYYLDDLDPAAMLTGSEFMERVSSILPRLRRAPALVEVSRGKGASLLQHGAGRGRSIRTVGTAPLVQQYTSGSTGTPKRVVRTHSALHAELETLRTTFETSGADRFLGLAPFSHVNGLVRTAMSAMYAGATLYPVAEFKRREVLDLLTRERITFLGAVPQVFSILSQTPTRGEADLSALRVAFSSSAPLLPADNRRFFARYGIVVRQLYGSTETGTISFNRSPSPESCIETVGVPVESVHVEVLNEKGQVLPPGVEGELAITSPFAASSYLENEAATRECFRGGAYISGDLGTKDPLGYLTITGRKKLMINRGGFKVNPYEVEAAIKEHPKVMDVAVFGTRGPQGDDLVCAVIVSSEICTSEEILAHCRERIADFKIPARIEFRDTLPKSATGKILRAQL
jgi:long-chain acyl-CoA synthetase